MYKTADDDKHAKITIKYKGVWSRLNGTKRLKSSYPFCPQQLGSFMENL